jgi:putative Mn2+ efflux pump MntP
MSIVAVFAIAVGLAMDAFAVAVSSGVALKRMQARHALLIATFFGVFQALMPFLGWHAGRWARGYVAAFDHWIAFMLLVLVGAKMIYDAVRDSGAKAAADPLNVYVLFLLAIATSIDALAIGITLSFLDVAIALPVLIIGLVTFVLSFAGAYLGSAVGHIAERRMEIAAGFILIGIGIKILFEHTLF